MLPRLHVTPFSVFMLAATAALAAGLFLSNVVTREHNVARIEQELRAVGSDFVVSREDTIEEIIAGYETCLALRASGQGLTPRLGVGCLGHNGKVTIRELVTVRR